MRRYQGVETQSRQTVWVIEDDGERRMLTRIMRHDKANVINFSWGYEGKGPADLALSILLDWAGADADRRELAERYHERFMREVIAKIHERLWERGELMIDDWVEFQRRADSAI
jgi:hypothetical protein